MHSTGNESSSVSNAKRRLSRSLAPMRAINSLDSRDNAPFNPNKAIQLQIELHVTTSAMTHPSDETRASTRSLSWKRGIVSLLPPRCATSALRNSTSRRLRPNPPAAAGRSRLLIILPRRPHRTTPLGSRRRGGRCYEERGPRTRECRRARRPASRSHR